MNEHIAWVLPWIVGESAWRTVGGSTTHAHLTYNTHVENKKEHVRPLVMVQKVIRVHVHISFRNSIPIIVIFCKWVLTHFIPLCMYVRNTQIILNVAFFLYSLYAFFCCFYYFISRLGFYTIFQHMGKDVEKKAPTRWYVHFQFDM